MEYKIEQKIPNDGTVVITETYTFKLSEFVTLDIPEHCYKCPSGYSFNNEKIPCGRNVPWTDIDAKQRPITCKLKTFDEYFEKKRQELEGSQ